MPMMNWLAMHHFELQYDWQAWVIIGFLTVCVIALVIIIFKYK